MKSVQYSLALILGAVLVLLPSSAMAQSSGVQIWSQRCSSCHRIQPANRYSAENWESIMRHMELYARLPSKQAAQILEFLKSGARKVASLETEGASGFTVASASPGGAFLPDAIDGEEVYATNCATCHGVSGKGDGPAAGAFNPPPTDFTDPEAVKNRSVEDLVGAISEGRDGMPAYGASLSAEEIEAVAEYIRSF